MSAVTIHDIAKRAGLNPSTVSRALRGDLRIREKTRSMIFALAEEMHYVPNLNAKTLANGKTYRIAFLLNSLYNAIEQEPAMVANRLLDEKGYTAAILLCSGSSQIFMRRLDQLAQKFCDGALVIPNHYSDEILRKMESLPCPLVFIDRWPKRTHFPVVTTDQKKSVELLFAEAEKTGYDAALVRFGKGNIVSEERLNALIPLLKKAGKPFFLNKEEFYEWRKENRCSGLCIFGDSIPAYEFCQELFAEGRRPKRVIGCGFDRVPPESAVFFDKIHICIQDFKSIGEKAVLVILALLEGKKLSGKIYRIPPVGIHTIR